MGAAKVEPAPLRVTLPPLEDELPPEPVLLELLSLLLPQAATPSASAADRPRAMILFDLTGGYSSGFSVAWWAATVATRRLQPVTDLWHRCEKGVKARGRSGSRSRRGCG